MAMVAVVVHVLARGAAAESISELPVAGEDDALYSCKTRTGTVAVTLKPETELKDLVAWVSSFTCKNFILDPRIVSTGKKVTVIAPNKMTASEAYRVFLVALSTINLTIVPKGSIVRIVEAPAAKKETVPLFKNGVPDSNDQVVRYVYRPTYAAVETLQQAFTALRSDAGDIQLIGSILLITDYGSHVRDMMSLAHLIDVASGSDGIYTLTVKHADATKLAEEISAMLGLGAKPGAPVTAAAAAVTSAVPSKILVDARTNTLLIAASQAGYNRVAALVERLDIALDIEGGSAIHVYRLGSAIAEELAKTLNEATSPRSDGVKPAKAGVPGVPPIVDALGTAIEGQIKVIADAPTNSLVVLSSGRDFLAIKDVIKQLDLPRRQVYIEAMILEIQIGNSLDVGVSSHTGIPVGGGNSLLLGGVQMPTLKSTQPSTLATATGLVGGVVGGALGGPAGSLLGKSIPSYAVLFQALATQSTTNVLSAPSIIALDNAQATYKVGTNIPFKRSQTVGGTGNLEGSVTSSIDRIDLQLELTIKPHVSIDDTVLLELKHDAKDLAKESAELGPSWTTRSFETRVLVRDQQTVVIGGLMQEREIQIEDKVPILGDIPVLGNLFKTTAKRKTKSNLVIMLTPYIVKDQMDLETIRARKIREHDEFAQSVSSLDAMPYRTSTDYRRKRGLVEEINRAVQMVEEDATARASLAKPPVIPQGVIEYRNDN
ncbi:MAG: type II secretion system secretin GspD [Deltaproteobacteria bacterium]|nr:type II secretion system secretin GspD [Deltaproteobacteria bacterium]